MSKIFFCYRHADSEHSSARIYARLVKTFGRTLLFKDDHSIPLGENWRVLIEKEVKQCRVLIAVIGRSWLTTIQELDKSRRADYVRVEIESAIKHHVEIVPVFVDGALMPESHDLPMSLRPLVEPHGVKLHEGLAFDSGLELLVQGLRDRFQDLRVSRPWYVPRLGRGQVALGFVLALWFAMVYSREFASPWAVDRPALGALLHNTCWIMYDPSEMQLAPDQTPHFPLEEVVERDLDLIKSAGFTGIITSGSEIPLLAVPRLAKQRGLRVIMGIWDPTRKYELQRAIRQCNFVDAYCVGHNGIPRYGRAAVENALWRVKKRTNLPATTTEPAISYDDSLATVGDWLFPDAHLSLRPVQGELTESLSADDGRYRVNVERDVALFLSSMLHMSELAQRFDRPLVFKNVAYPCRGIPRASLDSQREFFRKLLDTVRDPQFGLMVQVSIAYQGAFDCPWKLTMRDSYPWDPYTGLIDLERALSGHGSADGQQATDFLRPAAVEILHRFSGFPDGPRTR